MTARRIVMATALAVALAVQCGVAVTPARADDDDRRGSRHEQHDRGRHRGPQRRHRERGYYYAPRPRVYYAPPPVYVPPPPPPSIGFNLIFPFRFH